MKLVVLFGGCSDEYEVSLQSAHAVITHLDRQRYDLVLIGITRQGEWFRYYGSPGKIAEDAWHGVECVRAILSPSRETHGFVEFAECGMQLVSVDAAFPVLHGKNGEDGTVQGLLELAGIPIVGCGALSSSLCMDKVLAHTVVEAQGIAVPKSVLLRGLQDLEELGEQVEGLQLPLFVKPVRSGSSIGITQVHTMSELPGAVLQALCYDDRVVVEEEIPGVEVGCAVLGNEILEVGAPDEIEIPGGFFSYGEKYSLKHSKIHLPARIGEEKAEEVKGAAKRVYRALECKGFARVDFFLERGGRIVFNEVNTIPGFTAHSRYPSMMCQNGYGFDDVLDKIIETAVRV